MLGKYEYDLKAYNDEFLFVTYYDNKVMNIISLMDEKVIKKITKHVHLRKNNKVKSSGRKADGGFYEK